MKLVTDYSVHNDAAYLSDTVPCLWLRKMVIRIGLVPSVLFVGITASVASLLFTILVSLYLDYTFAEAQPGLLTAAILPLVVASSMSIPVMRLVLGLHDVEQQLRHHAVHDALTGLLNRPAFLANINYFQKIAVREQHSFALFVADIDDFKHINDTYGHAVGDMVLKALAQTFRDTLRASDLVGRFGGEEFVFFLPHADATAACEFATRLLNAVRTAAYQCGPDKISITLSIGGAIYAPHTPVDTNVLLQQADLAMYTAKNSGKDQAVIDQSLPEAPPQIMFVPLNTALTA